MSEEETTQKVPSGKVSHKPEIWVYVSLVLAVLTAIAWGLVFLRLGQPSVLLHAAIIPTIGVLTIPVMAWGLVTTVLKAPVVQKPRGVAFAVLLGVAYISNVPLFAPPLSTESWESPVASLPILGDVYVIAGGSAATNYHATTAAYRWGYDLTVKTDGKKFRLDGKKNEDYFCFDVAVSAPLGGKVIDVSNDIPDNVPGEVVADPEKSFGNYVLIEHENDVYIWVAHLKIGSIKPAIGDTIKQGQLLGKCGNSGRSIEPHVHVHAQNTPGFPYSESLPLKFGPYKTTAGNSDTVVPLGMPTGESSWDAGDGESLSSEPIIEDS